MRLSVVLSLLAVVALAVLTARPAAAQKACDLLLPPSGGSFEIAIHPSYLTSIQFPEKLGSAKTSDITEYEIRPDGDRGLLIRPKLAKAGAANINLTTGAVRLSVNLRTVDEPKDACAIVTFKATTEEDARQKAIDDAVAARTAALSAELTALKAEQAKQVRAQLDATIAALVAYLQTAIDNHASIVALRRSTDQDVAAQSRSKACSRAAGRPARRLAWRSGGCSANQDKVSATVSTKRRKRKPWAMARALLTRANPALSPVPGTHTGMSDHGCTRWADKKSLGSQRRVAPAVVQARMPCSIAAMLIS